MKHAVLGAGGTGGLVGAALARAGQPVTLLVRREYPDQLEVESRVLGHFRVAVTTARSLEEAVDVLWIAVKATQLADALASAPAGAAPEAVVVPLLNGIDHMSLLQEVYGPGRVAAGAFRGESELVGPGRIVQPGPFVDIELAGPAPIRNRLEQLRSELGRAGFSTRVAEDMNVVLWAKLAILAPFALASSAAGLPLGGLRADPVWRRRLIEASQEVVAVARAQGVIVERGFDSLLDSAPGDMRTSMQKDLEAGRPVELDAIAGPVLREGAAHQVPVPVTEELAGIVRERSAAR